MIRLDKSKIYVIAIVTTLILAGIGYAFLSSELNLNGQVSVKKHEQKKLPDEYKELEYIESTGTQYIDTGVNLADKDFKIQCKFLNTETTNSEQPIFSIWKSTYNYWNLFIRSNRYLDLYTNGHHNTSNIIEIGTVYTAFVERKNSTWSFGFGDEIIEYTYNPTTINPTTVKVFARGDSSTNTRIRIYEFKIYVEDKVVSDLIPCYRKSDGEPGMYDLVNDDFYTNQGTGDFTLGPVVDPDPEEDYVCKRATTLHTEICNNNSSYTCASTKNPPGGYNIGDTITYGSLGTKGTLAAGDAFDCDVNGDGEYNSTNERFYYVSDLDTDSNYGVLIYYNNVSGGEPNNTAMYAYDSTNKPRDNGPITALPQLPTTSQWKNVRLSNTTRKIKDDAGTEYIDFSYEGYTARLLIRQELVSACGSGDIILRGYLDTCKYLLENTRYSNTSSAYGWWLENPRSAHIPHVHRVVSYDRDMYYSDASNSGTNGIRPVIEVPKSKIKY